MRVRQGGSAKFEVIITGNPKPRVRWLFNNDPIVSPDYQVACYGDVYSLYIPEVSTAQDFSLSRLYVLGCLEIGIEAADS